VLEKESVEKIRHNEYSAMIKSSAPEGIGRQQQQQQEVQHPLFVSLLLPIPILLDLPLSTISDQQRVSNKDLIPNSDDTNSQSPVQGFFGIKDISLLWLCRNHSFFEIKLCNSTIP
jgi:hypothetical protein